MSSLNVFLPHSLTTKSAYALHSLPFTLFTKMSTYTSFPPLEADQTKTSSNQIPTDTPFPPLETDHTEISHKNAPTGTPSPAMDWDKLKASVSAPALIPSALQDFAYSSEGLSLLYCIQSKVNKVIVQPLWIVGLAAVLLIRSVNSYQIGQYLDNHDLPRNWFKLWFFLTYDILRTGVFALTYWYHENEMHLHKVMRVLDLRVVGAVLLVLEMLGCYWTTRFICAALFWGMFSVVMKQGRDIEVLNCEVAEVRFTAENLEIGIESAWELVREFSEQ
jgi:hypothetical protein